MKILLLSHTGEVTGGAEQCLLEYAEVLKSRGHKCKVIVPYKGAMTRTLSSKKIAWTTVGFGWATMPHRKVSTQRITSSTGNSLSHIFQEVERYKPELIINNTAVIPWGLYAGRAFAVPTVLLVHEVLSEKDQSLRVLPSYKEYLEIINENTDYIIYNSRFVEADYSHIVTRPKSSESILYPLPPLDEASINSHYKDNTIRGNIKIAVIGALSTRKNQMEVLEAAKHLRDMGTNNFQISLYGSKSDVPYVKRLRAYIRANDLGGKITIKGFSDDIYDEINAHHVIVSASKNEPFGRTIIEGQLFGRVVITNDTGGATEIVEDGVNGFIYKLGQPEELAKKIKWINDHRPQASAIGDYAKEQQFKKYINDSRYDALVRTVEAVGNREGEFGNKNIYNPELTLFKYNQELMHRYRYLYRLTHNRVTRKIKHGIQYGRKTARTIVLKIKP